MFGKRKAEKKKMAEYFKRTDELISIMHSLLVFELQFHTELQRQLIEQSKRTSENNNSKESS